MILRLSRFPAIVVDYITNIENNICFLFYKV